MFYTIGLNEAAELIEKNIGLTETINVFVERSGGYVLSEDIIGTVDSPDRDMSLKDGYAVMSDELAMASPENPVELKLMAEYNAGTAGDEMTVLSRGSAARVTTGSPIPPGADAVISEEFVEVKGDIISCKNTADRGRNILGRGTDIAAGKKLVSSGTPITPPLAGLLAASGLSAAPVYRPPLVAVIATGDEIIAPGEPLETGKLYASNLTEICSWLTMAGISHTYSIAGDSKEAIRSAILKVIHEADAFVTSGGAWSSERDLMLKVLDELKWEGIFHRVRMGPGKAAAFGLLKGKPFFCLPGGPPSNEMAFMHLALPGLRMMMGHQGPLFQTTRGTLAETVRGQKD